MVLNVCYLLLFCLGLPNALGGYDETPDIMASLLKVSITFKDLISKHIVCRKAYLTLIGLYSMCMFVHHIFRAYSYIVVICVIFSTYTSRAAKYGTT